MFRDFNTYRFDPNFRQGMLDIHAKYRSFASCEESPGFLDDIVCSLSEQSKLDIYNIVELKPIMLGSQLFFLDESQGSDNVGALDLNRQNTIDFILNTMFTSCSNFGFVELQKLFGFVVSTHMLLDVVGALKVVDYVNSLFECENHGLSERELVLKRLIENAPLVSDERFGGYEFNSVVHGFVAERFFAYQTGMVPANVESFVYWAMQKKLIDL